MRRLALAANIVQDLVDPDQVTWSDSGSGFCQTVGRVAGTSARSSFPLIIHPPKL